MEIEQPCQVDFLNEREIIQYMRALLDLHDLLKNGFDFEMSKLREKLLNLGWGKTKIYQMFEKAAVWTRYEHLIPRPIQTK